MRQFRALVAALAAFACHRDLDVPNIQPGSISGRLVVERAGQAPAPAAGATLQVLRSNVRTVSNDDGRFVLEPITSRDGDILVQFEAQADGSYGRQRIFKVSDFGAGPGHDVGAGDLVLRENASVRGRALLADHASETTGHRGTAVFVPAGPFVAQTADDGSYSLPSLPEGTLSVSFFRDGYDSVSFDSITVRAGESLTFRDVLLQPHAAPPGGPTASISGVVRCSPAVSDLTQAQVMAVSASAQVPLPVASDGSFGGQVAAGLYHVDYSYPGYGAVSIPNVLVVGSAVRLEDVTLAPQQAAQPDAGPPPSFPPPTAIINAAHSGRTGARFVLDGSQSSGPAGHPLLFAWKELQGDPVVLDAATSALTGFTAPQRAQPLVFQLSVTDDRTGLASVAIARIDFFDAPSATASGPAIARTASLATVQAQAVAPPGHPLIYTWRQIAPVDAVDLGASNGTALAQSISFFTPAHAQLVQLQVVVTDQVSALTGAASVIIDVEAPPSAAIAPLSSAIAAGSGASITLDASGSSSGHPLNYFWSTPAGSPALVFTPNDAPAAVLTQITAPSTPAALIIDLKVTDTVTLLTATAELQAQASLPPSVQASGPGLARTGASVSVQATATAGHPLTYSWQQVSPVIDPITIVTANAASASFVAPSRAQIVKLQVTATDSVTLLSAAATLSVDIEPPPVALAQGPSGVVAAGSTTPVALTASGSTAPAGHQLSFSWRASGTVFSPNDSIAAAQTQFAAPATAQALVVTLTVTDTTTLLIATGQVTVQISDPPAASISSPHVGQTGAHFTLDGSHSSAPGNHPLSFAWLQQSGAAVTLDAQTASITGFNAAATAQTLVFQLTVTDSVTGLSGSTTSSIGFFSAPTVAESGPTLARTGASCTVTTTASAPGGHPLTYAWRQIAPISAVDLGAANGTSVTFTAPASTQLVQIQVTVTDQVTGFTASDSSTVIDVEQPPVAAIAPLPTIATSSGSIALDASGSTTPGGHGVTYNWSVDSNSQLTTAFSLNGSAAAKISSFTAPASPGTLLIDLSVADSVTTLSGNAQISVTVAAKPTVQMTGPTLVRTGAQVNLNATATGPNGHPLIYTWQQIAPITNTVSFASGNGTAAAQATSFFAPGSAQMVKVQLTVTDTTTLLTATASTSIDVEPPPGALLQVPQGTIAAGSSTPVVLDASASTAPSGHQLSFAWNVTQGGPVSFSVNNSTSAAKPQFLPPATGQTLGISLLVTDTTTQMSDGTSVNLQIQAPPTAVLVAPAAARTSTTVTLSGANSTVSAGHQLTYAWSQILQTGNSTVTITPAGAGDPTLATTASFTAPATAQSLLFKLLVTDTFNGLTASDQKSILVSPPPTARVVPASATLHSGTATTLDGGSSSDAFGYALTYAWSVSGPGAPALANTTLQQLSFTTGTQSFTVLLTVTNSKGIASDPVSVPVTIDNNAQVPPTLNPGPNQTAGEGAAFTLTASATHPSNGETFTFSWTPPSGVALNSQTSPTPSSSQAVFTAPMSIGTVSVGVMVTAYPASSSTPDGTASANILVSVKDLTAPAVKQSDPVPVSGLSSGSPFTATATFSKAIDPATINATNIFVRDDTQGGALVPSDVSYDSSSLTARVIVHTPLNNADSYSLHVQNIGDTASPPNVMAAPYVVNYNARAPAWQLWSTDSTIISNDPIYPYIVWTPAGVRIAGHRRDSTVTCNDGYNGAYGFFFALDQGTAGQLVLNMPSSATTCYYDDYRTGDAFRRIVKAGSDLFAFVFVFGPGYTPYRRTGSGWTAIAAAASAADYFSDGLTFHAAFENYGMNLSSWLGSSWGIYIKPDGTQSQASPIRMSGGGDALGQFMTWGLNTTPPGPYTRLYQLGTGGWSQVAFFGGTDPLDSRVLAHQGLPVVVTPEYFNGGYALRTTYFVSTAALQSSSYSRVATDAFSSVPVSGVIGSFDAAMVGNTVYVAAISGTRIFVRHAALDAGTPVWVNDPFSGNTDGSLNNDPTCTAGRPSMDNAPDGLWVAWHETCGTTGVYRVWARKLQ